ncbi:MAG TPA: hypothetical protein VIV55_09920 [Flavobacterium sp.]
MTETKTLFQRTFDKLESMQIGESFDKTEFIKELYCGECNYFLRQNFDNMMNKAKNKLNEGLEEKRFFKSIKGDYHRLS